MRMRQCAGSGALSAFWPVQSVACNECEKIVRVKADQHLVRHNRPASRRGCACGKDDYDSTKWDACYNCRNAGEPEIEEARRKG